MKLTEMLGGIQRLDYAKGKQEKLNWQVQRPIEISPSWWPVDLGAT
jgi:hypothetical protein